MLLKVKGASERILKELALLGEGKAKINVTNNDQVDTGFMRNAIYAVFPGGSSYAKTDAEGDYLSGRTGQMVPRGKAPEQTAGEEQAGFACAADYAIWQEMKQSFMFLALEQLVNDGDAVGVIEKIGKEALA